MVEILAIIYHRILAKLCETQSTYSLEISPKTTRIWFKVLGFDNRFRGKPRSSSILLGKDIVDISVFFLISSHTYTRKSEFLRNIAQTSARRYCG